MTFTIEAAKRLKASDAVTYEPTPGAKKEKKKEWKPDVPVVKSEAAQRLAAASDIEIYTYSSTGKWMSSSKYSESTLKSVFGDKDAKDLMAGKTVKSTQKGKTLYRRSADAAKHKDDDLEVNAAVHAAAKGKHMPKPKMSKPHKAKAPANPEPKKTKPTKASVMAQAMRASKK